MATNQIHLGFGYVQQQILLAADELAEGSGCTLSLLLCNNLLLAQLGNIKRCCNFIVFILKTSEGEIIRKYNFVVSILKFRVGEL